MTLGSAESSSQRGPRDSHAWANNYVGLFVFDKSSPNVVDVDITVLRDVIAAGVVLTDTTTDLAVGKATFEAQSSAMTMVYLPRGERFRYATRSALGLRSVTMVLDLKLFAMAYGIQAEELPASLRTMMDRREAAIEQITPSGHVMRVVDDLRWQHGMFPSLPSLYLKGKACELISAWLRQLKGRDGPQPNDRIIDQRTRDGVSRAKGVLDAMTPLPSSIDRLAKEAAMNRTKLRAAFKEIYGTTICQYRTEKAMQRAESYLREEGGTVQEAAHLSGYANPSSFIVAYKRFFGVSPGGFRR